MSVRPPGYYTSWFHVVADIGTTSDIDLYKWIGDYTYRVYGYRWTNESKKLNAILTIQPGTVISASDLTSAKINSSPAATSCKPAILIGSMFRPYDRITIINKGKIIGSYGFKDYSGSNGFTPPAAVTSSVENGSIIITHDVTVATLTVAAGGGKGGSSTNNPPKAGGGGGSGGLKSESVGVTPGSAVTATGGEAGADASYSQGSVLISASAGGDGGNAQGGTRFYRCCGIKHPIWGFCLNECNGWAGGSVGLGGSGGTPVGSGFAGSNGNGQSEKYDRDDCDTKSGGAGGTGGGGSGGKGADACGGSGAGTGSAGYKNYAYTRKELYGPAIVVKHTNVRIYNEDGIIAGGYSNPVIYALYGSTNVENKDTIGGSIVPSLPGITLNPI